MVSIFDADNNYQPGKPSPSTPTYKGNDNSDDWNSSPKVPEVDEIPF